MKEMVIFHGSKDIIVKPIFGYGKKYNDYGLGFYCTENIELAKEWSASNIEINGYVNEYHLKIDGLNILYLDKASTTLNWISLLLNNRFFSIKNDMAKQAKQFLLDRYLIDISKYDIVIGYRADDSYFTFANNFINNNISIEQLEKALKLGQLGRQIVLISKKAFDQLSFVNSIEVDSKIYRPLRIARNKLANDKYKKIVKESNPINDTYVLDIMRKEMK